MRLADGKCRILLIGLMAAGKSSVGKAVSGRTGWPHLDSDDLVVEAAGMSKKSLLDSMGVEQLRRYERLAFDEVLEAEAPLVASIAGGVLLEESAVEALAGRRADTFVVWLRAPHSVITQRIIDKPKDRPWIDPDDPLSSVVRLASDREPVYERVADLIVEAYGASHEDIAAQILSEAAQASAHA